MMPIQKFGIDWPSMSEDGDRPVQGGAAVEGRDDAERNRHADGEHEGEGRQLDGRRKGAEHDVERRLPVRERLPEVAAREIGHEAQVLHVKRSIEAERAPHQLHFLGGGPLADEEIGRIAARSAGR